METNRLLWAWYRSTLMSISKCPLAVSLALDREGLLTVEAELESETARPIYSEARTLKREAAVLIDGPLPRQANRTHRLEPRRAKGSSISTSWRSRQPGLP